MEDIEKAMDVQNMKYSEMQKLAKQVGIKANMKVKNPWAWGIIKP